VVLSRFCGPEYPLIFELAEDAQVPVICHLDDNLIDPPILLGAEIWRRLKQPRRMHALYEIIERADLVYLSTPRLAEAIGRNCAAGRLIAGAIYVGAGSGELRLTAKLAGVPKRRPGEIRIGYMGSASHASDLEMIAPAIEQVIAQFTEVTFHLFGSVAATGVARRFTDRTLLLARVKGDYVDFRKVLALLDWDIGLAPLRPIEFNECKAPTKCIEYLDAGSAPIASNSRVYQPLAKAGAVLLADADDWFNSMTSLITDPQRREAFLSAGRAVLVRDFGWERLERQVIDVLALASASLENAA
jgi:hypothetical protein